MFATTADGYADITVDYDKKNQKNQDTVIWTIMHVRKEVNDKDNG